MNVLVWHVHGAYTRALVHGEHTWLIPATQPRDGWGMGVPADADWPAQAVEVPVGDLVDTPVDVVIAQRPQEIALATRLLGREVGRDVPVVFLEHNSPGADVPFTRHPMADRDDLVIVHVTHTNDLMWDTGTTRTVVVRHGVPDPGVRWSPEIPRLGVVVNEPLRRGRAVGTDLLPPFANAVGVDLFGMKTLDAPMALGLDEDRLTPIDDLPQRQLHRELARRTAYLHLNRWTSLGLSLVEAMWLGMPCVVLATMEAASLVPRDVGVVSADVSVLVAGSNALVADPAFAASAGAAAHEAARQLFGLERFLDDWDRVLHEALDHGRST